MKTPAEFKVIRLRECSPSVETADTADIIAAYWRANIPQADWYDEAKECLIVLMLNTRLKIIGHNLVMLGTLDTTLCHPREVFRPAIVAAAAKIVLMHNHPSGDPTPSEADVKATRELIRAGQILKVELLDHIVIGKDRHVSLRELGYFYS